MPAQAGRVGWIRIFLKPLQYRYDPYITDNDIDILMISKLQTCNQIPENDDCDTNQLCQGAAVGKMTLHFNCNNNTEFLCAVNEQSQLIVVK